MSILLVSSAIADEFTVHFTWDTEPRTCSTLENIPGQNGEDLKIWSFGWEYVTVWQPANENQTEWSLDDQSSHYSGVGSAAITFDTDDLPFFDDTKPFYLVGSVTDGSVRECNTSDTQDYSAFGMACVDEIDYSLGFVFEDLLWTLVD